MKNNLEDLEKIIGFPIKGNRKLLSQAFIHRSYINENTHQIIESNERLEFLGDAVLSLIVSTYIYNKFPTHPEGDLTNFRASLVKTQSLAKLAKEIGLDKLILLGHGEDNSGGRDNPSILADTFEALLGAIYLSFGLNNAIQFVEKVLFPKLDEIVKEHLYRDFKSMFQEFTQEKEKMAPIYKLQSSVGPDHAKTFTVGVYVGETLIAQGSGKSKQYAEQDAARIALEKYKIK